MSAARIAIIIPAYNVEKYIERCLDSVISQTFSRFEALLIDDGSTDETGKICDEYAKRDNRIRVLHKKNGGLSDARNYGLDHLSESIEYVSFIDSDDWVSPCYIENLYNAIQITGSSISVEQFREVFVEDGLQEVTDQLINLRTLDRNSYLEDLLYQKNTEICAWAKMYSRTIFTELRYPNGKLYEDIPTTYQAVKSSKRIALIDNCDYYYFQRRDSIQNRGFDRRKLDCVKHCHELMVNVKEDFPKLSNASECRYLSGVFNILFQIPDEKCYYEIREELWNEIKKYRRNVLLDQSARKKTRAACFISFFGYRVTENVYRKSQWRGKRIDQ